MEIRLHCGFHIVSHIEFNKLHSTRPKLLTHIYKTRNMVKKLECFFFEISTMMQEMLKNIKNVGNLDCTNLIDAKIIFLILSCHIKINYVISAKIKFIYIHIIHLFHIFPLVFLLSLSKQELNFSSHFFVTPSTAEMNLHLHIEATNRIRCIF